MSRSRPWIACSTLLFALVAFATGCGKSTSPTAPRQQTSAVTPQVSRDVAQHFAATLARQGGIPIDRVGGSSLQAIARDVAHGKAPLSASAIQDEVGFSWSLSVSFFDAEGRQQVGYLHGTTAQAKALARARGRVSTAEYQATLGIERYLDIRGLLPAETELHVDGTARDTASCAFDATDGSVSRRYDLLSAGTLEDLRQMKDSEVNPYPLSGVLRWNVRADAHERDAQGDRTAHYEARVKVTFNGTRYPTIEVDETWRYRMNLETGELTELPA